MINIEERITEPVREKMRRDVEEAGGFEVLWSGTLDEEGVISHVFAASRGHESATPAIRSHMQEGNVVIHNHPSGILRPSDADLFQASQLGNEGIGFYIVNNDISEIYVVVEPVPTEVEIPLKEDFVESVLSPEGPLSREFGQYEERPSQIALARLISEGFNQEKIIIAEAGTGVGKSFAYLIPALLWTYHNHQRVVISTATINLQQQILEKDLPLAQKITGTQSVKAVLVKGRGNYLCLNRLQEALDEDSLFRDEDDELFQIKNWSETTKDGSLSELPVLPDNTLWSRVCSETDTCLGPRCHFYGKCFVMKARREAAAAGILIVNHHLFFADLSLRIHGMGYENAAVLPPYHKIIFDEAHNIENSATSFFSSDFSRMGMRKYLTRLFRQKRGRSSGLLPRLEQICRAPDDYMYSEKIRELNSQLEVLDALSFDFGHPEKTLRIRDTENSDYLEKVIKPLRLSRDKIRSLLDALMKWNDAIEDQDRENQTVLEFKLLINRINQIAGFLENFCSYNGEDEENVYWMEKKTYRDKPTVRFVITPVDISSWMRSGIYDTYGTVIFTSATLTMDRKFDYWVNRVGMQYLDSQRLIKGQFASPFPYRENVMLTLPNDIPDPTSEEFRPFLSSAVKQLIELNEGRALILFTSYEMLKLCYNTVNQNWSRKDIPLLRQGSDERSRLLKQFTRDTASVLFATDSFWEGVDTPGESLRMVVICRLPFRVPSDPVYQARLELVEKRGGNPFLELSLPEAVMRFRQGFGRLMRRKTDRGAVVVLDARILRKNYGSLFLRSLPETGVLNKTFERVLENLENFIY